MTRRIRVSRTVPVPYGRETRALPRYRRFVGVSLVELLVALLVMGVGVLGVAGLQLLSMQSNRAALAHAAATQFAHDMVDRIRANSGDRLDALRYDGLALGDPPPTPVDCSEQDCTPDEMAVFDQATWKCGLGGFLKHSVCAALRKPNNTETSASMPEQRGLPDGDGAVAVDGGSGLIRVTVLWRDKERQRSIAVESRL